MAKKQVRHQREQKRPSPKQGLSRHSSKPSPKAKAPRPPKKAPASQDLSPDAIAAKVAQTILLALGGAPRPPQSPPRRVIEEPEQTFSALDLASAESDLYPPETQFSDQPDLRALENSGPTRNDWASEHNDERVTKESVMSYKGQTDAKIEVLANKVRVLETHISALSAHLKARR